LRSGASIRNNGSRLAASRYLLSLCADCRRLPNRWGTACERASEVTSTGEVEWSCDDWPLATIARTPSVLDQTA
jgi:hypothetical protein